MVSNRRTERRSANLQTVKLSNLTLIFGLINQMGSVSRAELAQEAELSPTTVSSLVDELIAGGVVREVGMGETVTSGRKPIMLEVDPAGGAVAAVELRRNGYCLELFDLKANCRVTMEESVTDYLRMGESLIRGIRRALHRAGVPESKLFGISVGVPGVIDKTTGRVISSTILPIDEENPFFDELRDRFPDIKLRLGNESCFSAYMEKVQRKRIHSLVYVEINEGIGAGIVVNDHIFTGAFGNAGELGHVSVDVNGPRCKCGNRGCLELLANAPAIREKLASCGSSHIGGLSFEEARCALELGDAEATSAVKEICRLLASGINSMINILNPEAVILGGEVIQLGDVFLEILKEQIDEISFKPGTQTLTVEFSSVQGNPVTQGGARYLLDRIFQDGGFVIS